MLSRDFVQGYLIGQVDAGVAFKDAQSSFSDWLGKQADAIVTSQEKEMIIGDLGSYSVPGI